MKYYTLDTEEKKLVEELDRNEFIDISDSTEKSRYQEYARSTLSKNRNINIRLSERDLQKIKIKAAEKGIPYQTLAASILHQCSNTQ